MSSSLLMVVADCPGYFLEATYRMAAQLRSRGVTVHFAVTSRYYERHKKLSLGDLGQVHYISDYLRDHQNDPRVSSTQLDYWLTYSTFARTRYFFGKHINEWDQYRRLTLFFRDLLDENPAIAAVWSEAPSSSVLRVAQRESERHGIPYLGYISARVPQHFNVGLDSLGIRFMENPAPPVSVTCGPADYMAAPIANMAHRSLRETLRGTLGGFLLGLRSLGDRSIETDNTLRLQLSWYRRQITRSFYYRHLVPKRLFSPPPKRERDRSSIVFPLNYRPEASTSVQAQHYASDLEVIRNIAFSLPHGTDLFVKEHPSAVGQHSRAFYRELLSFPNVFLLDIEPRLSDYLANFDALVCLSSTAGFEALQLGIPVLLLGRSFYENYEGVLRVTSFENLGPTLEPLISREHETFVSRAFERYLLTCFSGTFSYLSHTVATAQNIERLVRPIEIALANPSHG